MWPAWQQARAKMNAVAGQKLSFVRLAWRLATARRPFQFEIWDFRFEISWRAAVPGRGAFPAKRRRGARRAISNPPDVESSRRAVGHRRQAWRHRNPCCAVRTKKFSTCPNFKAATAGSGDVSSPKGGSDAHAALFKTWTKPPGRLATRASPAPYCDGSSQPPEG